jgi:sRNA-binding carbon storage regulator CsrA
MALILSMKAGEDFYVGDACVSVRRITSPTSFVLRRASDGAVFTVDDKKAAEILPNVFVSAGHHAHEGTARVAIDAPRELRILRGVSYLENERNRVFSKLSPSAA